MMKWLDSLPKLFIIILKINLFMIKDD